jgi:CRISPR/Cas system-associated exonuclease Cas4 (RecB family)
MKQFLKQVVDHYFADGKNPGRCFIFPNRRSQVFFTKYLGEAVEKSGKPVVAPKMMTINDFFFTMSKERSADRVNLLLDLYECYSALNPKAEPLDEFIFWGDVILGDFDDVDKYLVDPEKLFANISDFKSIQDSYSYLTENQRKAIESFVSHFSREGKLTVDLGSDNPNVKERFLQVWNILMPLYTSFRARLSAKGLAYEGMAYRSLASRLDTESASDVLSETFGEIETYVFVGLNALNECEKKVMRKMRDAHLAEFCWDYSSSMVKDPMNKSSFFMSKNVVDFPQSFEIDPEGLKVPEIEVISVPSSVGQAKLIPTVVKDENCAVVLPDESLLVPVLNSIPENITDINVTMGYPMKNSSFYDFFNLLSAMQMHLRQKDGKWYFYHTQVWSLFCSGIFKKITAGDKAVKERVKAVKKGKKYYIPQEDLSGLPLFDLLFRPVVTDPKSADAGQIEAFAEYQKSVIKGIAPKLAADKSMAMELEFAKAAYNAVNRLKAIGLGVLPLTYVKLLGQLFGPVSVPFKGEPLKGLQIMGPLETRALDFPEVMILSCNEGVFPRRSVSSSFVPPELRKGFGLPTYEFQDAVWAYYFYRLLQRAEKVTLVYDSRTEGLKNGEESRYIKQLQYHFNVPLKRSFVKANVAGGSSSDDIPKTEEDVETLHRSRLSASALQNYLYCPAKFYYHTVKKLHKTDEVSEDLDSGMLGNVFHKTMERLYSPAMAGGKKVTADYLASLLKRRPVIKDIVVGLIMEELHSLEVTGRDLVVQDVIIEYVLKTLSRDLELLKSTGSEGFEILGLELQCECEIDGFNFIGFIDRLDSLRPGEVRVVDYKTGKVEDKDVNITDSNAAEVADALFGPVNKNRPKIALQLYLYDVFCPGLKEFPGGRLVNVIYPPANLFTDQVKEVPVSGEFMKLTEDRLHSLLTEIASVDVPFRRTEEKATCEYCDFRMICGR